MVSQSAPGIYTNVANHIGWIEDQVKENILSRIMIMIIFIISITALEAQVKKNGGMASCSDLITSAPSLGSNDQFTF